MASVLVPLAEGSEELEAVTLIDLFRRAEMEVTVAAATTAPVRCSRGVVIVPDARIEDVRDRRFDLVALPGGLPGALHLAENLDMQAILKAHAADNRYVAAICAAPRALAAVGLLDGKRVTAYPGALDDIHLPTTQISYNAVEIDGNVVTSRGPGTAMDFALSLIELLLGAARRQEVEQKLVRV